MLVFLQQVNTLIFSLDHLCKLVIQWQSHVGATVKPPVSGHPRTRKSVRLREVRLWEVKNGAFVCSWEHDQVSGYVCLQEVSVCGGSTVSIIIIEKLL